jgi:hypothetical protein
MAVAFKPFEQYVKYLATGKLDGYLDSTRREDKVTVPGVLLPNGRSLLLHNLGKDVDLGRIGNLFTDDTVFVASAQVRGLLILICPFQSFIWRLWFG